MVKRYQKLARIPGFRAGKVPESLVRSKFAKEVRQEVMEIAGVGALPRRRFEERKLKPVSRAAAAGSAAGRWAAAAVQGGV